MSRRLWRRCSWWSFCLFVCSFGWGSKRVGEGEEGETVGGISRWGGGRSGEG